jgi:mRNA interferase RelE/StbE
MKKGDLAGIYGYDIYYCKANYEIAYTLDELPDGTIIIIIMAGTRENFWNEVKKYIKS